MRSLPFLLPIAAFVFANVANAEFDWQSINSSKQLEYHDCYHGFKCARLTVPLDWKHADDNRTASIAMLKLPAVVPDDSPLFGGSIFLNPGGPGFSGVEYALLVAKIFQMGLFDKAQVRHYEIVSFDPRGVGRTTPAIDCFRSNGFARAAWNLEDRGKGSLLSGETTVGYSLALMKVLADRCKAEEQFEGVMDYVNTPSVARDMVEMIDKIDELRRREAAKKQGNQPRQLLDSRLWETPDINEEPQAPETRLHRRQTPDEDRNNTVPRLQYLGFSYGTVLGTTFASMFPGRVGRMVLDGVVNAQDYYHGDKTTALKDADKVFDEFWRGCWEQTDDVCPLRQYYTGTKDAKDQFWRWIREIERQPAPVYSTNGHLMVMRGSDVLNVVSSALHNPIGEFKELALGLHEAIVENDFTRLASRVGTDFPGAEDKDSCPPNLSAGYLGSESSASVAITCGDGLDFRDYSLEYWIRHVINQVETSKVFGPLWSSVHMLCSSWRSRPNWEFHGPFSTPAAKSDPVIFDKPAAPLLFLSNRFDPVTPLSSAREMIRGHPGAGLLIQATMGHCVLGSELNPCTRAAVSEYFDTGKVQKKEFYCGSTCDPWKDGCDTRFAKRSEGDEFDWSAWANVTAALRGRSLPFLMR